MTAESTEFVRRGVRRVDLDDETLLLDAAAGRVVRLRGTARAALDSADTPEAHAVIRHLSALGVFKGDAGALVGASVDITRRDVLSASAAVALGVTVMALPSAAEAVSGAGTPVTQFIQAAEFAAPGDPAPGHFFWSFLYSGRIHVLDGGSSGAAWRLYVFTTGLETVEVINVTGLPSTVAGDWNRAGDFAIVGDFAYIATYRGFNTTTLPRLLDVVRITLPLEPVDGAVAATVWSIDVSDQVATEDLSGQSWTFLDAGGVPRSISGSASTAWRPALLKVGRTVVDGAKVYVLVRCESQSYIATSYVYEDTASETVEFRLAKYVFLSIDTAITPTPAVTFTQLGIDLYVDWYSGARTAPADPTTNLGSGLVEGIPTAAVLRSGDVLFLSRGSVSVDVLRISVADPALRTVVRDIQMPALLTEIRLGDGGSPTALRIGDRLLLCAAVKVAGSDTYVAAVVGIDLAQATMPVTEYAVIPDSALDPRAVAPIAYNGSYLFTGFLDLDYRFLVARLTANPLAWDATAIAGLGTFKPVEGLTAQPTPTGVFFAGWNFGNYSPFALFAGVAEA